MLCAIVLHHRWGVSLRAAHLHRIAEALVVLSSGVSWRAVLHTPIPCTRSSHSEVVAPSFVRQAEARVATAICRHLVRRPREMRSNFWLDAAVCCMELGVYDDELLEFATSDECIRGLKMTQIVRNNLFKVRLHCVSLLACFQPRSSSSSHH